MPGKKKKFIDKKNAVTFSLVHRSQRDPLQADDESSKFVLQQVDNPNKGKQSQLEEQQKFGVYYEDDYNYMQHIRESKGENAWELSQHPASSKPKKNVHFTVEDLSEKPKLQLPAGVFQSEQEEDVGMLNRAAPISGPRLDLDPDIVAAMDEDFDFDDPDNELDDDFMMMAQSDKPTTRSQDDDDEDDDDEDDEESGEDYDSDDLDDDDQKSFASEETKSRFTSYSMTSSVIKRNEGLTLLDDRFEKIFEEYDDMEIGALDQDEIEGRQQEESLVLQQAIEAFEKASKVRTMNEMETATREHHQEYIEEEEDEEEEKEERMKMYIDEKKEQWDCESILSTYSTLYNHPTTIKEPFKQKKKKQQNQTTNSDENGPIKLSQKSGMPLNVFPSHGPTKKQLEREELEDNRLAIETMSRVKGEKESAEERKERKQAVKLARKERRLEKKANQQVFKDEEKRQNKVMHNLKQNLQGVKIL